MKDLITKDMIDGAEILMKRVNSIIPYMSYQKIMDMGGVLEVVHKEYMKMVDEWSDSILEQVKTVVL